MNSSFAEVSASVIESLEKRLSSNPHSPVFARLASLYLNADRVDDARSLCERGLSYYPDYATAHLILGQCFFHLRRFGEAATEFTKTLSLQPRCDVAQRFLDEARALSVSDTAKVIAGEHEEVPASPQENVPVKPTPPPREEERENRIRPAMLEDPHDAIATPTLAEIYANQGAYEEAIRTYTLLLHRRPEERGRFQQRIKELEEKWRSLMPPS